MIVEDQIDRFPVGMRVLAVDDDPTCLRVLESLLRKCQYHVTITNQAVQALKMLRENRDKFDLVISDVNMPDMDGFNLLEQVGLEMDLPVIMLSAHSDTKLVMKGITHGAVDYLLKPVRIEELKNIWQHVLRKKKFDPKDQNKSPDKNRSGHGGVSGGGEGFSSVANEDNGKVNRKRKDQNEDEEEDGDENELENDDPSNQKKARVVWSVELHRKFVAAVNQLGLEKAVPKKILDLMNVEGLTRENVASHLQKYRLYLKRISIVATQQANMVAAFGGSKDGSSYMRLGSLDGFGFTGSGPRISNSPLSSSYVGSYPPSGILNRLNSPSGSSLCGGIIPSHGLLHQNIPQNLNNSITSYNKFHSPILPSNQSSNIFEGIPTSLELNPVNDSIPGFSMSNTFNPNNNSISSVSTNPLLLRASNTRTMPSSLGSGSSSNLVNNESWQVSGPIQPSSRFPSNAYPSLNSNNNSQLPSNIGNNNTIPVDFPSSSAVVLNPLHSARGDGQCQEDLIGNVVFSAVNSISSMGPSSINNPIVDPLSQSLDQNNGIGIGISPLNGCVPAFGQNSFVKKSPEETIMVSSGPNPMYQTKSLDFFSQSSYGSLDDIMNSMIKREEIEPILMDGGELGFDAYSLGSCI